jgi:hypothetical protein
MQLALDGYNVLTEELHRPNVPAHKVLRLEILLIVPIETNVRLDSKNDVRN